MGCRPESLHHLAHEESAFQMRTKTRSDLNITSARSSDVTPTAVRAVGRFVVDKLFLTQISGTRTHRRRCVQLYVVYD